jgi:hypothetical protein
MDIKKSLEIIVLDLLHFITTFKLKYLALLAISGLVMAIILDNHQVTSEFRQIKSIVSVKASEKLQQNIYNSSYKD